MTLAIAIVNPEGVVVAADSRQSYTRAGVFRVGSESGIKLFELTNTVVAATSGYGFLRPATAATPRNISSLVEDWKPTVNAGASVQDVATALYAHLSTLYTEHIGHFPNEAVAAGHVALTFLVAGYDPGSRLGVVFDFHVPGGAPTQRLDSNGAGTWLIGQNDVALRLFNGYDNRILTLPVLQAAHQAGTALAQLQGLAYLVNFHTMTLQDAIDFVTGTIQITIVIQRFADGIAMQPGGPPGVGGPIDVAVIRPGGGAVEWIERKALHP